MHQETRSNQNLPLNEAHPVIRQSDFGKTIEMLTFWLGGESSMTASNPSKQTFCTDGLPAKKKSISSCFQ